MGHWYERKWLAVRPESAAARYGLSLASLAIALGLSEAFLYFHLPLPFAAFALCAIAIAFWYGGVGPGVLAALLSALVRGYFFEPEVNAVARIVYDLVFLIFALLMTAVTRAREGLETRVAQRTAELTQSNKVLQLEVAERARAEAELRESEAYLAEAQRLTRTGSFALSTPSQEIIHWSHELYNLFGFDPKLGIPSLDAVGEHIHEDDRARVSEIAEEAIHEGTDFEVEGRVVLPGRAVRHLHGVGHSVFNPSGELVKYVGTVMDVSERRRADEERERLRQAQEDLARISRVTTMGELTASLAHEVNQPIAATITDANTCLRWLMRDTPDVDEARQAASRVIKDATRAADIISRIRLVFEKTAPRREPVDVNEIVRETILLMRGEAAHHRISVRTELAPDLPPIVGDRVQVQQVMMNLIMNSVEAMKDVDGSRDLVITSKPTNEQVMVSVSDTGVGLSAQHADQIFKAFFTTKVHGTGMGLSISRSIVESHGGRLWAAANSPRGASFHLTLPTTGEMHEPVRRPYSLHHR